VNKDRFLTVRWNNLLALVLGALYVAYTVLALATSVMSNVAGFIGVMIIGVLY
jgi:hypothetical protein